MGGVRFSPQVLIRCRPSNVVLRLDLLVSLMLKGDSLLSDCDIFLFEPFIRNVDLLLSFVEKFVLLRLHLELGHLSFKAVCLLSDMDDIISEPAADLIV